MRSVLRPVLAALACLLGLGALNHSHSAGLHLLGRSGVAPINQPIDEDFEAVRSYRLDEQMTRAHEVMEIEQSIVRDFVAGSVSLLDAGDQFSELEQVNSEVGLHMLRVVFPGAPDRELYCRQVILRALTLERLNPIDELRLRSRLKDQFKHEFSSARLTWLD